MKTSSSTTRRCTVWAVAATAVLGSLSAHAQDLIYNTPGGSTNTISAYTNAPRLFVGIDKANNHLSLDSSSNVEIDRLVEVGQQSKATNSLLSVDAGGLLVIGAADTNNMPVRSGILVGDTAGEGKLKMGYDSNVTTENLYVGIGSNETGKVTLHNGGLLEVTGSMVVGATNSTDNIVTVGGGGKLLISETSSLVINNQDGATEDLNKVVFSSDGSLLVKGDVHAPDLIEQDALTFESGATLGVGGELTTANNALENGLSVMLDNALSTNHTSRWDAQTIDIGYESGDNSLIITNGAAASSAGTIYIGSDESATGNDITAGGSNSTLIASSTVYVGVNGDRNSLNILDGATATVAGDLIVGSSDKGQHNSLLASGLGSSLTASNDLYIGADGANNSMTVADDASATILGDLHVGDNNRDNKLTIDHATATLSSNLFVGANGDSNDVLVKGTNAILTAETVVIGGAGDLNNLKLNDGAQVSAQSFMVGQDGDNNFIELRGSNSTLLARADITVGAEGDGNKLNIYGGTASVAENLYLGSSNNANNSITISGADAVLAVTNQLFVGSDSSSNNTVSIRGGGLLYASAQTNIIIGAATNNTLTVANTGTLKTHDWDMSATDSNITFEAGSTLHLLGEFTGTNAIDGSFDLLLDGTTAQWNTSTNMFIGLESDNNSLIVTNGAHAATTTNLYVGYASQNNSVTVGGADSDLTIENDLFVGYEGGNNNLILTNGASAMVSSNLYIGYASQDNSVTVGGADLEIGADLFIGTENNASSFNMLEVLAGASVSVTNDVFLYRAATLKIDSSSQVTVGGDYEQDGFSTLEVGISSNQVQPNLVVDGNAGFATSANPEEFSMLKVFNNGIDESNVVKIVQASSISLDGETITGGSIEGNIASNALLGFSVSITNDASYSYIVLDDFIKHSWTEAGGLEGMVADVANEIESMMPSNDLANAMDTTFQSGMTDQEINKAMNDYYGEKPSSAPMHNVINQGIGGIADQLTVRGDNTRTRMEAAADAPAGAAGPHSQDQQLQGWIAGYGAWSDKTAADGFSGYDANLSGFIIGTDLAVSQNILVGLAGGSNSGSVDKDNGASGDTKTTYGAVYASVGTKDWFLDGSVIYGSSSIDSTLGDLFDTTASYDARNIAFYLGGGKEIIGQYLIITPQASLLANYYEQDAYDEKSTTAVARSVDSFDALYVQSSLGCSLGVYMAMGEVTLKPEVRAHWLHEFNGDEETLPYSLVGGNGIPYSMTLQAPEADILRLGAGIAAKMSEYLELRFDLDTQQASDYSDYTVLGSLRYQF